jgi:hypothetical protein
VGHPGVQLPPAPTNTITSLPAIVYNRRRVLPIVAPYLPSRLTARLSNYVPLESTSFADQVRAGMSSSNFDVESANVAEGSGEGRVGLDDAGVEEVRRIMWVAVARGRSFHFMPKMLTVWLTLGRINTGPSNDVRSTKLV